MSTTSLSHMDEHKRECNQTSMASQTAQCFPSNAVVSSMHVLVTDDGIVWKGHEVVIPEALQLEYTQIVYRGHPEAESTRRDEVAYCTFGLMTHLVSHATAPKHTNRKEFQACHGQQ